MRTSNKRKSSKRISPAARRGNRKRCVQIARKQWTTQNLGTIHRMSVSKTWRSWRWPFRKRCAIWKKGETRKKATSQPCRTKLTRRWVCRKSSKRRLMNSKNWPKKQIPKKIRFWSKMKKSKLRSTKRKKSLSKLRHVCNFPVVESLRKNYGTRDKPWGACNSQRVVMGTNNRWDIKCRINNNSPLVNSTAEDKQEAITSVAVLSKISLE